MDCGGRRSSDTRTPGTTIGHGAPRRDPVRAIFTGRDGKSVARHPQTDSRSAPMPSVVVDNRWIVGSGSQRCAMRFDRLDAPTARAMLEREAEPRAWRPNDEQCPRTGLNGVGGRLLADALDGDHRDLLVRDPDAARRSGERV